MEQHLVTVVIPNYNSLKYIKTTLECIFNQTHKNLEIIVVDDGSTDGSYEFIESLNRPNLKLEKNPTKGACAARNHGLRLANGKYVQFLDADDLLDLDKIGAQVKLIESTEDKVVVCSTRHFYKSTEEGIITDASFLYDTNNPSEFLLNITITSFPSCSAIAVPMACSHQNARGRNCLHFRRGAPLSA